LGNWLARFRRRPYFFAFAQRRYGAPASVRLAIETMGIFTRHPAVISIYCFLVAAMPPQKQQIVVMTSKAVRSLFFLTKKKRMNTPGVLTQKGYSMNSDP
jgi:hypothetical protein